MSSRVPLQLLLFLTSIAVCSPQTSPDRSNGVPLLYTVARDYEPMGWIRGVERFPRGAMLFFRKTRDSRPLTPNFFSSADANVSFDGNHILFSARRYASDHWQIWEVRLDGGPPRQITRCEDDCVRPFYAPPDRFVYAHKVDHRFVLEIAPLTATADNSLRLTHAPGNFFPVDVLRDGRILFEAAQPLDSGDLPELYTVYTDGSGVEAYRCDHGHARYAGKQISSGDIVFVRDENLYRFTSAVAHEVAIPSPAGAYAGDVTELPDGTWLTSWHARGAKFFELRQFAPESGELRAYITKSGVHVVEPALLMAHPMPNRHPSGLHEWSYANVLCLNAYTSKYKIADGTIASLRLYTRDAHGDDQFLGASRVEKDGSFYLRVPGDQPLKIELLDGTGTTLRKEAGWFWLRSGEQRVCVGCHAGPETAPENVVPAVLLRSTVAADLTGAPSSAAGAH